MIRHTTAVIAILVVSGCETSPAATLLCTNEYGQTRMELRNGTLTWRTSTDNDKYTIVLETENRLVARQANRPEEYAGDLEIDRVSGKTVWTTRISNAARLLVDQTCRAEITEDECKARMEGIAGGNIFSCTTPTPDACARAAQGSNVIAQHQMVCVPRQF
jgi:hypothetical protein